MVGWCSVMGGRGMAIGPATHVVPVPVPMVVVLGSVVVGGGSGCAVSPVASRNGTGVVVVVVGAPRVGQAGPAATPATLP
jgi:hypothetical protein